MLLILWNSKKWWESNHRTLTWRLIRSHITFSRFDKNKNSFISPHNIILWSLTCKVYWLVISQSEQFILLLFPVSQNILKLSHISATLIHGNWGNFKTLGPFWERFLKILTTRCTSEATENLWQLSETFRKVPRKILS